MGAFDSLKGDQVSSGYWGQHTSTIDWCEANYAHTPYIAETVNTLTNLPFMILGLSGFANVLRNGLPKKYSLCYLGLTLIGIGSFGFHMSLRWEWQLMDELPMIYLVSYAAYLVLETSLRHNAGFTYLGPAVMLAWDVFVTVSYIYLPNPVYHQVAFAIIILTTTARTAQLAARLPAGHPVRGKIGRTMARGVVTFALGFAIWNIDNVFCDRLRVIRGFIGPLGVFTEGHAYWHLMTGYGSYLIFTASILLHLVSSKSLDAYSFDENDWFPVIKPIHGKARTAVKGDANGHVH
ncbi:hypothetical protein IAU60_003273 [Kwoniella sp. DSM 27419]